MLRLSFIFVSYPVILLFERVHVLFKSSLDLLSSFSSFFLLQNSEIAASRLPELNAELGAARMLIDRLQKELQDLRLRSPQRSSEEKDTPVVSGQVLVPLEASLLPNIPR